MNDDQLRKSLDAAVPEPPDTSTWAANARASARSRNRGRWATAGVAVTLVAVLGGLLWPRGPADPMTAVPAASPGASTDPAPVANPDCIGTPDEGPADGAREQVVRITLCPRSDGPTFTTPADSLTTGINEVIQSIVALPKESPRDPDCTRETDRLYLVVLVGQGGSRTSLEAATPNACGVEPRSDSGRRWAGLLTILREAWAAQRATLTAPDLAVDCLPYDRPGLFTPQRTLLTHHAVCVSDPETGDIQLRGRLTPELFRVVADDVAQNTTRAENIDSRRDGAELTLAGPWGDPLVFWRVEGGQWFAFVPDGGGTQLFWQPGPEAEDALQYVLQNAPSSTPTATATTNPQLPDECRGLSPSSGPLPNAATRLRLCPTEQYAAPVFTPLDPVEASGAQSVLAVLNGQQPLPTTAACTEEYGPDFLLVAEFNGRPPVVMQLQVYGCRVTGTTDDVRIGAEAVLAEFKAAVERQRAVTLLAEPRTRPGSLCRAFTDEPTSVMPVRPEDAVSATHCRYAHSDDTTATERRLTAVQRDRIVADLARTVALETVSCPALPAGRPVARLALANAFGDVLVVSQACVGVYTYRDPAGDWRAWQPSKQVQTLLDRLLTG